MIGRVFLRNMSISVFSAVGRRSTDAACIRVTVSHIGDTGRTSGVPKAEVKQDWNFSPLTCLTLSYIAQVALIKISWVVHYSQAAKPLFFPPVSGCSSGTLALTLSAGRLSCFWSDSRSISWGLFVFLPPRLHLPRAWLRWCFCVSRQSFQLRIQYMVCRPARHNSWIQSGNYIGSRTRCWIGSAPYHRFNSPRRVMSELGPAPSRWHLELSNGNKSQLILEIDFCFFLFFYANECCRKQPGWYRPRVLLANKRWWNQRINEDDGAIRATVTWCCWVTLEPLWRLIAPMEPCCWRQEWF